MIGLGRESSTQMELSGWPKRQPREAPESDVDDSLRLDEEPRQKAQLMRERLLLKGF